jgi:hypothetical protein
MKLRFEVRSIKQKWKPPFTKDITDEVFDVEEGQTFDRIQGNGNDQPVYALVKGMGDRAIIQYSKLFTLKTGNPGNYQITLNKDDPISMTYLWGEDGVTKKITIKGASPIQETTITTEETQITPEENKQ